MEASETREGASLGGATNGEYTPTIGLEIHAELKTKTKMFCESKNDPNESRPNVNVCPVCMAHPGVLPVINREAVKKLLSVGVALQGTLADYTEFDRKNYFYPDQPKGYQLSQYEYPLISGGELNGVSITRIHLEEDTARSSHDDASGETLIDYNRAGVPLMELVTEPVVRSAEQAAAFARDLQLLLRYLDASEANMEKGEMRVEANVSVSKSGERGTKVEIKNLNSFRSVERAVRHEIDRQIELLERGERVVQETRGWDEGAQKTYSQRVKETSADYRYFPDPDLSKLLLSEVEGCSEKTIRERLPRLPAERKTAYEELGVKSEDASMFVMDTRFGDFFDVVIEGLPAGDPTLLLSANYIANDLAKEIRDAEARDTQTHNEIPISARDFKTLMTMIATGELSSRGAKDTLTHMLAEGATPEEIVQRHGLKQMSNAAHLMPVIDAVIQENTHAVEEYRGGKDASLQYLLGQAMKKTKGAANPHMLRELLLARLA